GLAPFLDRRAGAPEGGAGGEAEMDETANDDVEHRAAFGLERVAVGAAGVGGYLAGRGAGTGAGQAPTADGEPEQRQGRRRDDDGGEDAGDRLRVGPGRQGREAGQPGA